MLGEIIRKFKLLVCMRLKTRSTANLWDLVEQPDPSGFLPKDSDDEEEKAEDEKEKEEKEDEKDEEPALSDPFETFGLAFH